MLGRFSHSDTEKEIAQGWGSQRGEAEWRDEQVGEAIARTEEKEVGWDATPAAPVNADDKALEPGEDSATVAADEPPAAAPAAAAEPEAEAEDNTKSYADYLAEQANRRLDLGTPEARQPNAGVKPDKKWAQAKELKRDEAANAFIAGSGPKAKRDRQRKEKTYLDIEPGPMESPRGAGGSGGRGGGGRGRGDGRGDYRARARGAGRGSFRGRGGRGAGGGDVVNVTDTAAFPSLGGGLSSSS